MLLEKLQSEALFNENLAFSYASWYCRPGLKLFRGKKDGEATKYAFVVTESTAYGSGENHAPVSREVGSDEPATVTFEEGDLPLPPTYLVEGGFFDNITSNGQRGWGYTLASTSQRENRGIFGGPTLCFVYAGPEAARVAVRSMRVEGTPLASTLRCDVVGFIPGDDTQPTIEGIVGKDIAVQQLQPPCIVRIYDVPTDGRVAFGGVFVSALGPSH